MRLSPYVWEKSWLPRRQLPYKGEGTIVTGTVKDTSTNPVSWPRPHLVPLEWSERLPIISPKKVVLA